MKKIILAGLLVVGIKSMLLAQQATEVFQKVSSLEEALAIAKKSHKMLFVDGYFQGCSPCAKMDKEVYPNSLVAESLQKDFISVKVDVFRDKWGQNIPMRYAISSYPCLLILNEDGLWIARATGYKDPGQFLQLLSESKTKNRKQSYLMGFGTPFSDHLPAIYKEGFTKRKTDPVELNKFIHAQNDWLNEKVGLAILTSMKLDKDVEDFLVINYQAFVERYGEDLVNNKVEKILLSRMARAVKNQKNEPAFQQFLKEQQGNFSKPVWKNYLQVLGSGYYANITKDTTAYLQFMSKNPVIYQYYFTAFFAMMCLMKNDSQENLQLMAKWGDAVANLETSLEIIQAIADVYKRAGDMKGYRKYINLCLEKIAKYKMNNKDYYEKLLAAA